MAAMTAGIDVDSYTCAACGALVDVSAVQPGATSIPRSCGHDDSVVHANLRGCIFGAGALAHGLLEDERIPEAHRKEFFAAMRGREVVKDGIRRWWVRDWVDYINDWHERQAKLRD